MAGQRMRQPARDRNGSYTALLGHGRVFLRSGSVKKQRLPPAPGLSEADVTAARFVWLFPSTAIVVLPNHAFVLFARPEGQAAPWRRP
jgi:hypothetical protein